MAEERREHHVGDDEGGLEESHHGIVGPKVILDVGQDSWKVRNHVKLDVNSLKGSDDS